MKTIILSAAHFGCISLVYNTQFASIHLIPLLPIKFVCKKSCLLPLHSRLLCVSLQVFLGHFSYVNLCLFFLLAWSGTCISRKVLFPYCTEYSSRNLSGDYVLHSVNHSSSHTSQEKFCGFVFTLQSAFNLWIRWTFHHDGATTSNLDITPLTQQ